MLTERKDVKCSHGGGIWLLRYERESLCFFSVVLQQSRRVCGTLQDWTIAGEHCGNQKAEGLPCRLPKADILWTVYLSRVRKRERSGHMRDNKKVGVFCRNASKVQWRRHISRKWNVEAGSHHTLEGKLCKRKGKSKGNIPVAEKIQKTVGVNIERMEDKWQRQKFRNTTLFKSVLYKHFWMLI